MGDIHVYQDPVYIKHRDLKYIRTRVTTTLLCNCVNNHLHSTTASVGAQHLKFCWALFVKTSEARNELIENGLTIYGVTLTVHKENPVDTSPSEKLVLKDLPIPIPDSDILQYYHCEILFLIIHSSQMSLKHVIKFVAMYILNSLQETDLCMSKLPFLLHSLTTLF